MAGISDDRRCVEEINRPASVSLILILSTFLTTNKNQLSTYVLRQLEDTTDHQSPCVGQRDMSGLLDVQMCIS